MSATLLALFGTLWLENLDPVHGHVLRVLFCLRETHRVAGRRNAGASLQKQSSVVECAYLSHVVDAKPWSSAWPCPSAGCQPARSNQDHCSELHCAARLPLPAPIPRPVHTLFLKLRRSTRTMGPKARFEPAPKLEFEFKFKSAASCCCCIGRDGGWGSWDEGMRAPPHTSANMRVR